VLWDAWNICLVEPGGGVLNLPCAAARIFIVRVSGARIVSWLGIEASGEYGPGDPPNEI